MPAVDRVGMQIHTESLRQKSQTCPRERVPKREGGDVNQPTPRLCSDRTDEHKAGANLPRVTPTQASSGHSSVTRSNALSRRQWLTAAAALPALVVVPGVALHSRDAWAGGLEDLNAEELARLGKKGSVERRFNLDLDGRSYLAALSYSPIARPAADVFATLSRPADLKRALPVTRDAKFVHGSDKLRVVHGTFLINGGYTLMWQPNPSSGEIRFWLDASEPHDVQDVLGYFRVREHRDGCLLTVAVAVDTGTSPVASLFRGKIHDYMSRPARYIARYVNKLPENVHRAS